ncbi:MAG: hybrid sensor histidine kinase/response regulator [Bacteroidota bacterium]
MPRLLLIDDDPNNLEFLFTTLQEQNPDYDLLKVSNPEIALKNMERWMPDLVITDWNMPQMSGLQLMQQVKANANLKDIPFIITTGVMVKAEHLKAAIEVGAVDYIRKPIDAVELNARVSTMLRLASEYAKVKHVNTTKDRLFSILSHDLRGPINTLKTLLEAHSHNLVSPEEFSDYVKSIRSEVEHVSDLLENLLRWARAQFSGSKIQLKPKNLIVAEEIGTMAAVLDTMAKAKEVDLSFEVGEQEVFADPEALKLILRNLITNAIKFTPARGHVSLHVETENDQIAFRVRDTGVGIKEEKRKKLFEGLVESQFGTNGEKGIGLGLMLSFQFAQAQGGIISVISEPNQGSEFTLCLPKAEE